MNRITKLLAAMLMLATVAIVAAQCGAQPTPETVTVIQTVEKTVIQTVEKTVIQTVEKEVIKTVEVQKEVIKNVQPVIYNSNASDPEPRKVDDELVKMFEDANPEYPVQHSIVNHEDFKQAIRAYLVADPSPDVLTWFAGNRARFFIDKGLIMDISDLWQNEGWNDSYPKGFRALSEVDGKAYFVPSNYYWWAIFYRKSVFEANNITPPKTWDNLLSACDTLSANGIIPITIGTKYRWTAAGWFDYLNMRVNGPEFHRDLMLGKESYTDPRVKNVFVKWKELFDHKCFIDNPAAYSWQEAIDPFNQGDAAMYLIGQFIMDSVAPEVKDDVDFFQFPIIDPSVSIGEDAPADGYFISAKAQNPEGAKKFLAFLGSKEAQTLVAKEMGRLVTNTEVDRNLYGPMEQKGLDMLNTADLVMQFYDRDTTPEMADEGMNGFMAFWDNPGDIDAILEQLETKRQELFVNTQ